MPRSVRAPALVTLVAAALAALLDGRGARPRLAGARREVPEGASLPLTASGLALLALAHRRRLDVLAAAEDA